MTLNKYFKRDFLSLFFCIAIIIASTFAYFLYSTKNNESLENKYVVNNTRILTNPIYHYLSEHQNELFNTKISAHLYSLSNETNIDFIFAKLDGSIMFDSSNSETSSHINIIEDLHYDLYDVRSEPNLYKIAFPVLHQITREQIGNIIFSIPYDLLFSKTDSTLPVLLIFLIVLSSLVLIYLCINVNKKIKSNYSIPLIKLKNHINSILKSNYDEPIQYGKVDEVGELFATLDLLRTEIKYLKFERIKQIKAQQELITNISHDIKTPITTVKAYIDAILEGICSDEEQMIEYIKVMRTHINKTTRLVEDLLVHALKELGQITVESREQYSQSVLKDMLEPISHHIIASNRAYVAPQIPNVLINIDSIRIEQVITNLVSNALKHTDEGHTICIETTLEKGCLKIAIADNGGGIKSHDIPFIFERYYKGEVSTKSSSYMQDGIGIGLSICKTIIEAHQGEIGFASIEGQGTTFYFTLPIV